MNCTIPFSRNGETTFYIACELNAFFFPIISSNNIVLPKEFPKMDDVEIKGWDKMELDIYTGKCPKEYQLTLSDVIYIGQNCKSKNENMISLLGTLRDTRNYSAYTETSFTLRSVINKEPKNISCEIRFKNDSHHQMDCIIKVNNNVELNLYETMVFDEKSRNYIFFLVNNSYQISECTKKNKFINFNGKTETKFNTEKSLFELDIYSETIGFEEEKIIQFNLARPKYSQMNCIIPSSNSSNNNTFIKCTMDMNKYPLLEMDYFILPNNIFDKDNCSLTKWDTINKDIIIYKSSIKYSILFSPYTYITTCDDKGNNIIIFSGFTQSFSSNNNLNFNISGIVDDELKNISCNLNVTGGQRDELKCIVNGKNRTHIFQTIGVDSEKKEIVLIKVNNEYMETHLMYCPVSKTKLILAIVLPIVGAIIIIVSVILIIRYKRKHSNNTKEEIEKLENMNLLK